MYQTSNDPSTPNLEFDFGIDYAPPKVRGHGLCEAHIWPLASQGKVRGEYQAAMRVHASAVWSWPEIELRAANSFPAVIQDVDGRDGTLRVLDLRDKRIIPPPNWMVIRDGGGCHAVYTLSRPVHRGVDARLGPMKYLARIEGWLSSTMGADGAYAAVLSHNPMSKGQGPGFSTLWGRKAPYSLPELSDYIPKRWRRPAVYEGAVGRNCDLFASGMRWAGSPLNLGSPVLRALSIENDATERPLPQDEVRLIAASVERYRVAWVAKGRFYTPEERTAWGSHMGLFSAQKRRERTQGRDEAIVDLHESGMKQRQISERFHLTKARIGQIIKVSRR